MDKAAKTEKIAKISSDVFKEFKRSCFDNMPEQCSIGEFLDTGISVASTFMSVILGDLQLKGGDNINMVNLMNDISTNIMLTLEKLKNNKELVH